MARCFPPDGRSREGEQTSFPSPYEGSVILRRPSNSTPPFLEFEPSSSLVTGRNAMSARASKIHSEAERRRRERINAHLSTLRCMIPDANKMDKASLLGRVIDQVKDLKRRAGDFGDGFQIPSEVNEVTVEYKRGDGHPCSNEESLCIEASICCDDRPDLFADLIQAFHGLRLRTVRAEMTSLAGRVMSVFVLCREGDNGRVCSSTLKQSVEAALAMVVSPDSPRVFPSKRHQNQ